jgi:hypothetical protein
LLPHRRFLINPDFQIRFLISIMAIAIITIFIFFAAKIIFFASVRHHLLSSGMPREHVAFTFLAKQSRAMDGLVAIIAFVECLVLGFWGLWQSNRIAGPLYRLQKEVNEILNGAPVKKIRFRENDFFPEVAELANKLIARLKK